MKRVFVALLLAACGGDDSGGGGGGGGGEPAELAGITDFHNQVRAMVQTATPLPPMQWDSDLAAYAAAWAAKCTDGGDGVNGLVDHDPNRTNVAGYPNIGENIFGSSGATTAQAAVNSWASEQANFTYPSTCNGTCGHYTQVVWRDSVSLGCAMQVCSGLKYGYTIVCDYGPAGNSGGAPY